MTSHGNAQPLLYTELADWFHLLTAPEEYVEEAEVYRKALIAGARIPVKTVLELGSGGGNNASHMKRHFEMTLSDLSPDMLAISKRINPELEHIAGDMRSLHLGRTFDAVFAHDAVSYLLDEDSVRQAVATAFEHLNPGGVALFAPDDFAEDWAETHSSGGNNAPDGRGLRYLEWTHRGGFEPPMYAYDLAYMMRGADGSMRTVQDRHVCAAHSREAWLAAVHGAGFDRADVQELLLDDGDADQYFHIVATKPL